MSFATFQESEAAEPQDEFDIVRRKQFSLKPMSVEEAILQMNLIGHQFFLFRNAVDNEVNLVYVRRDGKYGVIEPE
nr:sigma 54 modulation/S30EA ribosomal C-terminal domain-containing protein [Neobittarella massiliensis]